MFALPTNFAQGFSIVMAIIIGMQSPLTAIQVLTVNMVRRRVHLRCLSHATHPVSQLRS